MIENNVIASTRRRKIGTSEKPDTRRRERIPKSIGRRMREGAQLWRCQGEDFANNVSISLFSSLETFQLFLSSPRKYVQC